MAKLGTLKLIGASGITHSFDVYGANTSWRDGLACVYYVSKRTVKPDGSGTHAKIYIGETEDLANRFASHHKQPCFERHGYNAISIIKEANAQRRLAIEDDLVHAEHPPCND